MLEILEHLYRCILQIQCQLDDQELFDMVDVSRLGQLLHAMSSGLVFLLQSRELFQ